MNRDTVASHVALWTDMTRRAPDEVRAAPASLLGFASWLSGHGAVAWCALEQVPQDKPYALAGLVAAAVQSGMHPREWRRRNPAPRRASWIPVPSSSRSDQASSKVRFDPPTGSEARNGLQSPLPPGSKRTGTATGAPRAAAREPSPGQGSRRPHAKRPHGDRPGNRMSLKPHS